VNDFMVDALMASGKFSMRPGLFSNKKENRYVFSLRISGLPLGIQEGGLADRLVELHN
jgi:hypothetical protein